MITCHYAHRIEIEGNKGKVMITYKVLNFMNAPISVNHDVRHDVIFKDKK